MEFDFRKKFACLTAVLLLASLTALSVVPRVVGHEGHGMPPIVDFSATPTAGTKPLTVNFTATAYYGGTPPFTYTLDFGDDTTSTSEQNPSSYVTSHTYQNTGTYMAKVWETDSQGNFATNTVQIVVTEEATNVSASATPTAGAKPLVVDFTATLLAGVSPITYEWDFGDGTTSTEQNPSHMYQNTGTYTAWVTATDAQDVVARTSVQIVVTEETEEATATPEIPWTLIGVVVVILAVVVAFGVLLVKRRR